MFGFGNDKHNSPWDIWGSDSDNNGWGFGSSKDNNETDDLWGISEREEKSFWEVLSDFFFR